MWVNGFKPLSGMKRLYAGSHAHWPLARRESRLLSGRASWAGGPTQARFPGASARAVAGPLPRSVPLATRPPTPGTHGYMFKHLLLGHACTHRLWVRLRAMTTCLLGSSSRTSVASPKELGFVNSSLDRCATSNGHLFYMLEGEAGYGGERRPGCDRVWGWGLHK